MAPAVAPTTPEPGPQPLRQGRQLLTQAASVGEMLGMKPYSEDLRTRIVRAVEGGTSKSAAARLFGVSLSSVKR